MKAVTMHSPAVVSRRAFGRRVLGIAAGALAAGPAATSTAAAGKPAVGTGYVDIHVHLTQPWASRPMLSVEKLLAWMNQHGVAQAVVLPLVSPEAWYYTIGCDWVLQQTLPHRDRLIPFCDIDPRAVYLRPADMAPMLARYVAAGAKGLGEHKCGTAIDDPRNLSIFRACSELRLPVLLHMDNIRNTDEPGLPGLERVLRAAPEAKFIGHATTWWSSISADVTPQTIAGYPKGPVKPGGAIDRLMDKYENLYGDLSAGSGLNAIRRDPDFGREFLIRRADRLLFGTDYLAEGQQVDQFAFLEQLRLPAEVQAKIFRDNARRVLGLK
jgi:predicted TIM-barrel fold metal-dependent hydrolase